MNLWAEYYSNPSNLEKIVSSTKYREVVIIKREPHTIVIRPIKIYKLEHFLFFYERLGLNKIKWDLYISNASVRLPSLPSDLHKLKEVREYLNVHWMEIMNAYDIFVDCDASSENDEPICIDWAKQIMGALKSQGYGKTMPIEIWKTGSGGVHLILKGCFQPLFVKELIMDICCELGLPMSMPIKEINGLRYIAKNRKWVKMELDEQIPIIERPHIDTGIWDSAGRRIRRCPFSLHSKTGKPMVRVQI